MNSVWLSRVYFETIKIKVMDLLKYRKNILPDYSKMVVSVSGGRTSMFMAYWIKTSGLFKDIHTKFIFANTGKEREETLDFVNECDIRFNLGVIWIEADIRPKKGKGTSYKITNYKNAKRKGEPFDTLVKKYGLPNNNFGHCTRDLKRVPIIKATKALLGHNVYTAIGIRQDERNRINRVSAKKDRYIYPLVDVFPVNEKFIREWWDSQDFDLQLKDYQGNCDLCFKKSLRKRLTILKENPSIAKDWEKWENTSEHTFDRNEYTVGELIEMSKLPFNLVQDKHEKRTGTKNIDIGAACICK